jgi:hypothetical protein
LAEEQNDCQNGENDFHGKTTLRFGIIVVIDLCVNVVAEKSGNPEKSSKRVGDGANRVCLAPTMIVPGGSAALF